ncbi:hypothetical protein FCV25MIE_04391, partial [Fagus crenata]
RAAKLICDFREASAVSCPSKSAILTPELPKERGTHLDDISVDINKFGYELDEVGIVMSSWLRATQWASSLA